MTELIGPHVSKEDIWNYNICQTFIHTPQSYINSANIGALVQKFPKKDINYKSDGKVYVIHTGYVNNIQSIKDDIVDKSFSDLKYIIKASKMIFNSNSDEKCKIYINMHLISTKNFDKEKLDEHLKEMPKNMKLLIEHTSSDDFENFLKIFVPMCSDKIGLTFDTAHIFGSGYSIEKLLEYKGYEPDLIHLNGNTEKLGSKKDIHTSMCSQFDKIWSKELLGQFLRKYDKVPKVIENREAYSYKGELQTIEQALFK